MCCSIVFLLCSFFYFKSDVLIAFNFTEVLTAINYCAFKVRPKILIPLFKCKDKKMDLNNFA